MAKYNSLSGSHVIASQNANEVDLPPPGRYVLFRDNTDGKIYYKTSDGRVFPVSDGGLSSAYASGAKEIGLPGQLIPVNNTIPFDVKSSSGVTVLAPGQFQIDEAGTYEITFGVRSVVVV